jgi:hypothetical protein
MADSENAKQGARAAIDWEAAFAYYAALAPAERSYAAVAAEFGVSVRTVETHGRSEQWKARLHQIKAETRKRNADALIEARVEEIEKLRRLIDASFVAYADCLRSGMRMSPADLERLNRLSRLLIDEAIAPQLTTGHDEYDVPERTMEHAHAVLEALAEAGALEALGLARILPPTDPNEEEEVDHE